MKNKKGDKYKSKYQIADKPKYINHYIILNINEIKFY